MRVRRRQHQAARGGAGDYLDARITGRPLSPTLCVCHGVSQACVRVAIEGGATNIAAVGENTKSGTGCGSCRPGIAALLAAAAAAAANEREAVPA